MKNAWLQYGGIGMIVMAVAIAITPFVKPTEPRGADLLSAAVVAAIGIMSIRKARIQH